MNSGERVQLKLANLFSAFAMFLGITGGGVAIAQGPLPGLPDVSSAPVGGIEAFGGSTAPPGWLMANGSAVSRTAYFELFAVIGTTYGAGDGSTTFNLPDLRGRVPVGVDGTAGRLSANDSLGDTAGEEKHTLTVSEMPSHDHGGATGSHDHGGWTGYHSHGGATGSHDHGGWTGYHSHGGATGYHSHGWLADAGYFLAGGGGQGLKAYAIGGNNQWQSGYIDGQTASISSDRATISGQTASISSDRATISGQTASISSSGSGQNHNVMQPYQVVNYIIHAKPAP